MSERIALPNKRRRASRNCQHRWVIETPHGKTSRGLCRRCGSTKRFPNAQEDIIARQGKAGLGRWSGQNDAVRPKQITLAGSDDAGF